MWRKRTKALRMLPVKKQGRQEKLLIRPLQPLLCSQHIQTCRSATCQGSSYTKTEYSLFYQKFDAKYFLFNNFFEKKKLLFKKKSPTTVQICRLENIEHESMKQVSHSGKYSLSASRAHQSYLRSSFVVGNAFCPCFLHV